MKPESISTPTDKPMNFPADELGSKDIAQESPDNFDYALLNERLKSLDPSAANNIINDPEMGERILRIGVQLEKEPRSADLLFAEFARIIESADIDAVELEAMYNEIFFDKKIDHGQALKAILGKGVKLLAGADKDLQNVEKKTGHKVVEDLISGLRQEEKINKNALSQLKAVAADFNRKYSLVEGELINCLSELSYYKPAPDEEQDGIFAFSNNGSPDDYADSNFNNYDSQRLRDLNGFVIALMTVRENNPYVRDERKLISKGMDAKAAQDRVSLDLDIVSRHLSPVLKKLETMLNFQTEIERTFDSFVYGRDNSKSLDQNEIHNPVFRKYQEIVDLAKTSKASLRASFAKGGRELSDAEIDLFMDNVLQKAEKLLQDFTDKLKKGGQIDEVEIAAEMDNYKADLILTASVWKSVDKSGLRPEDMAGVAFEAKDNKAFSENLQVAGVLKEIYEQEIKSLLPQISQFKKNDIIAKYASHLGEKDRIDLGEALDMLMVYGRNYRQRPAFQEKLLDAFAAALTDPARQLCLYSYKKDGQLLAFNRFEDQGEGGKYFGSFNVDETIQDSALGCALFTASLEQEGRAKKILAHCDAFSPVSSMYIEKGAFVVKKIIDDYDKSSQTMSFEIERDSQKVYKFQNISKPELVARAVAENKGDTDAGFARAYRHNADLVRAAKKYLEQGYAMSRYLIDRKTGRSYAAFERAGS